MDEVFVLGVKAIGRAPGPLIVILEVSPSLNLFFLCRKVIIVTPSFSRASACSGVVDR